MMNSLRIPEGSEFVVGENVSLRASEETIEMRGTAFVVCTSGNAIIQINLRTYEIRKNTHVSLVPTSTLRVVGTNAEFRCSYIMIAPGFMESLGFRLEFDFIKFLLLNPVCNLAEVGMEKMASHIYPIAAEVYNHSDDERRRIKMYSIVNLYIVELSDRSRGRWEEGSTPSDRQTKLFMRFLEMVKADVGGHREVEHYANSLSVTPRYLGQICKRWGLSPKRIIDENLCFLAKLMLYETDKTIQQIAEELNFADQSIFTRYFRRITGKTPSEWREVYWK